MINLPGNYVIVKRISAFIGCLLFCCVIASFSAKAQDPTARFRSMGGGSKGKDTTLQHRTGLEDSISINYRFLDSSRLKKIDYTIYDFS